MNLGTSELLLILLIGGLLLGLTIFALVRAVQASDTGWVVGIILGWLLGAGWIVAVVYLLSRRGSATTQANR